VKATGNITVSATPACSAGAASTTPTLTVNTALTNITHATTSATGIGIAIGLPAGVSAAWSADVITISGTPTASGTFSYTIPLTGTSCSAVNATGTITVSACPTATIAYNSYTYNTGSIGTQCWMQENLRTRLYNDGTEISFNNSGGSGGTTSETWSGLTYGAHTLYAYDSLTTPSSNLSNYGYLYNWYAAKGIATAGSTTYKNICPTGWHVPTDSDWNKLIKSIDSVADTSSTSYTQSTTAGGKMKSTGNNTAGTGLWNSPNTGADNASGFTALPGGYRDGSGVGSFDDIRAFAFFWSATEGGFSSFVAWGRFLYGGSSVVNRSNYYDKSFGASVRCLKD
jgi:uncharacterized protein (TIGR02145 family)